MSTHQWLLTKEDIHERADNAILPQRADNAILDQRADNAIPRQRADNTILRRRADNAKPRQTVHLFTGYTHPIHDLPRRLAPSMVTYLKGKHYQCLLRQAPPTLTCWTGKQHQRLLIE